jgi:D-aminopeptidase
MYSLGKELIKQEDEAKTASLKTAEQKKADYEAASAAESVGEQKAILNEVMEDLTATAKARLLQQQEERKAVIAVLKADLSGLVEHFSQLSIKLDRLIEAKNANVEEEKKALAKLLEVLDTLKRQA